MLLLIQYVIFFLEFKVSWVNKEFLSSSNPNVTTHLHIEKCTSILLLYIEFAPLTGLRDEFKQPYLLYETNFFISLNIVGLTGKQKRKKHFLQSSIIIPMPTIGQLRFESSRAVGMGPRHFIVLVLKMQKVSETPLVKLLWRSDGSRGAQAGSGSLHCQSS